MLVVVVHSLEDIVNAINSIGKGVQKLKNDFEFNKYPINNLSPLGSTHFSVNFPEYVNFELYKLSNENEHLKRQNANLKHENDENTEKMNNLVFILSYLNTKIRYHKRKKPV